MIRSSLMALAALALVACGGETPVAEDAAPATAAPLESDFETAGNWTIDREASSLRFRATQNGNDFTGTFSRWDAAILLDPEAPDQRGAIEAVIDLASVDAGNKDRNEALPKEGWFNIAVFPKATFRADRITSTGDGTFDAEGTLTIKGVEEAVALPFTLAIDESGRAVADGSVMLDRSAFGIGQGEFATDKWVAFDVEVLLHIEATPAG